MIKIRKRTEVPEILRTQRIHETQKLCDEYLQNPEAYQKGSREPGSKSFDFNEDLYKEASVRTALREDQHNKCCYCEWRLLRTDKDVEHFRPKKAIQQHSGARQQRPGYYWLVYDWSNLLLACPYCNRNRKRNIFPLRNPQNRAVFHLDTQALASEEPLLINPTVEDPAQFLEFEGIEISPKDKHPKGRKNIDIFKLNDEEMWELRLTHLKQVKRWLDILKTKQLLRNRTRNPEEQEFLQKLEQEYPEIKEDLEKYLEDSAQFAAMTRAAFPAGFDLM